MHIYVYNSSVYSLLVHHSTIGEHYLIMNVFDVVHLLYCIYEYITRLAHILFVNEALPKLPAEPPKLLASPASPCPGSQHSRKDDRQSDTITIRKSRVIKRNQLERSLKDLETMDPGYCTTAVISCHFVIL